MGRLVWFAFADAVDRGGLGGRSGRDLNRSCGPWISGVAQRPPVPSISGSFRDRD